MGIDRIDRIYMIQILFIPVNPVCILFILS